METDALALQQEAILDSIADGLIVYDGEGRIVRQNARAAEMLGYSAGDRRLPVTERAAGVIKPLKGDGSPFGSGEFPVQRALRGETVSNEIMILHVPANEGAPLRISVSSAPMRTTDGTIAGCVTTFRDVGELHRIGEALAQREATLSRANAELEAVLSALPDGLIVYDREGRIVRINDVAMEMLGYREDTWKRPVSERVGTAVQVFRPDGTPCPREEYVALRALAGQVVRNVDQYIHLPERPEKSFWAMLSGGPVSGPEGELAGAVVTITNTGAFHEVNERLGRQEAALREANAELHAQAVALREAAERLDQRVQERTAQLALLSKRLVEMQENERSFVADRLYNQANQVLAAVKIQLRLLEREQPDGSPLPEWAEIKATLDLAMRELHGIATQLRPVSLDRSGLVAALKQYLLDFGESQGLSVEFHAEGAEGLRLPNDVVTSVYRVIQEALANVARHAGASRVDLRIARAGDSLTVALHDDGAGFDPAASLRRGTVGLTSMHERIRSIGGSLSVQSAPGKGTEVLITVPVAASH